MMDYSNYNTKYLDVPMPQNLDPYKNMNSMMMAPTEKPDIGKFMHDFNDANREKFNDYWFTRNDDDLIRGIEQVILSCQRDKYFILKVVDFEVITEYEDINRILHSYFASKTKNGKKVENNYDYIDLKDSDIMLLKVKYYIKLNIPENKIRVDPKTGEVDQTEGFIEVLIELPRYVNHYYYRILGNYYIPMIQVVDGSTYNNATSNSKVQTITLKTQFMPIKVYKEYYTLIDCVSGEEKRCVLFTAYIFKKKTDTIKFMLGRYGIYGALEFLEIEGVYIQDKETAVPMNPDIFYNFIDPTEKVMLSVVKRLFDRDNVTQSFCFTILKNVKRLEKFEDIFDPRYWNRMLGADFQSATLDKGISVLDSLESIYDLKTKESIRLPMEDKEDTYKILRWIMREFNFLKQKDNIDISTKHPRMADEYLPAIYAAKLSTGLYSISDKGKNITFKEVVKRIDIAPNYILKNINQANLVNYVDLVNDNDAELALSYTYKGISGLGDQGGSAVPLIYRSVHPSHLGKVDLDSSSASDPGLSGIICPMAKVYDGSFSDFVEPNGWKTFYTSTLEELRGLYGMQQSIEIKKKLGLEYDYVKEDMVRETIETYQRLIPAVIDLDGKKDYTLGAVIPVAEEYSTVIVESNSYDEVGEITASEEDVESSDL